LTGPLIVGEALIDIVVRPDGSTDAHPGGSPANVAVTLGRLGAEPRLLADIGNDSNGALLHTWLNESAVHLEPASVSSAASSTTVATLDHTGSAQYDIDLHWNPTVPATITAPLVHVGSISAILPGSDAVLDLVTRAQPSSIISYDPNIRPVLLPDRDAARQRVEELVAVSDIVKVSDEDLLWLYPNDVPADAARRWRSVGPALIVLTVGGDGALAITAEGETAVAATRVDVADTVGAGDTLMGTLIWALGRIGIAADTDAAISRTRLSSISAEDLRTVLAIATRAAAITVSRPGANPPWLRELTDQGIVED
jgi:fructokinase